jgi:chaperonin GroEL (HSP60 family)
MSIKRGIDKAVDLVVEKLKKMSKPLVMLFRVPEEIDAVTS